MPRFAEWLVRIRWQLLLVGVVSAIAAWYWSGPLPLDRAIEHMFSADDPARVSYEQLVDRFAANEVVLAAYVDPQLLDPNGAGLERLSRISQRLRQVPGVRDVLSLAQVNQSLTAFDVKSLLRADSTPPLLRKDNALASRMLSVFEGFTHGADGETAGVVCLLIPEQVARVAREQTLSQMSAIMQDLPDDLASGLLAGEPVLVADGFRYVTDDGQRLTWIALSLVVAAIAFMFRSLRWTLIPLLVVQLTQLLSRAMITASGARMTLVSSMMSAMLTVIVVAAVVHVIVRVREYRAAGMPPIEALQQAATVLTAPIAWATVTNAIAFASLMASDVGPVRDYGLSMTVCVLLVPICIGLLVPGLAQLGSWDARPRKAWGEGYLDRILGWSSWFVERGPRRVALASFALGIAVAAGLLRLDVETDFTKNFHRDSPLVRSYEFVERRLSGAGVWDVMVPVPAQLTAASVARIERLESRLRTIHIGHEPGLTKVLSLVDAVEALGPLGPPEMRAQVMQQTMPSFFATLRARDDDGQCWLRIMLRSRERQSAAIKQRIIDDVRRLVADEFPGTNGEPAGATTGFFVLLTQLIRSTLRDQWVCFGLSSIGIAVALVVALRSWRLALIALVTNAVPILIVLGIVGWLGRPVNLGVAMIAAVSLGISVDGSLHYLADFRRRRAAGDSTAQALRDVQQTVGRAVVFATLALIVGFLSLTTSRFVPTVTFGLLTALAMLGSLLGNLIVLPALIWATIPASESEL